MSAQSSYDNEIWAEVISDIEAMIKPILEEYKYTIYYTYAELDTLMYSIRAWEQINSTKNVFMFFPSPPAIELGWYRSNSFKPNNIIMRQSHQGGWFSIPMDNPAYKEEILKCMIDYLK